MKVLICSHESDIDGMGNVILSKIAFGSDITYRLFHNPDDLEKNFRFYLISGELYQYDLIFTTDLALFDPSLEMVANDDILKNRIKVIDHHEKAIKKGCNRYPFTTIMEKDDTGMFRCATDLFYHFLVDNNYIERCNILDDFVELVRLEDVWEWKAANEFGVMAHDLAILFSSIGKEKYIDRMFEKIINNKDKKFFFDSYENKVINIVKEEYSIVLPKLVDSILYLNDEFGNKFGIVYADYKFRNDLKNFIIDSGNPQNISYLILVALDKGENGQKSYRSVVDHFNVNDIAMNYGGGGHPGAACVEITKEQKNKALTLEKRDGLKFLANCKFDKRS